MVSYNVPRTLRIRKPRSPPKTRASKNISLAMFKKSDAELAAMFNCKPLTVCIEPPSSPSYPSSPSSNSRPPSPSIPSNSPSPSPSSQSIDWLKEININNIDEFINSIMCEDPIDPQKEPIKDIPLIDISDEPSVDGSIVIDDDIAVVDINVNNVNCKKVKFNFIFK